MGNYYERYKELKDLIFEELEYQKVHGCRAINTKEFFNAIKDYYIFEVVDTSRINEYLKKIKKEGKAEILSKGDYAKDLRVFLDAFCLLLHIGELNTLVKNTVDAKTFVDFWRQQKDVVKFDQNIDSTFTSNTKAGTINISSDMVWRALYQQGVIDYAKDAVKSLPHGDEVFKSDKNLLNRLKAYMNERLKYFHESKNIIFNNEHDSIKPSSNARLENTYLILRSIYPFNDILTGYTKDFTPKDSFEEHCLGSDEIKNMVKGMLLKGTYVHFNYNFQDLGKEK